MMDESIMAQRRRFWLAEAAQKGGMDGGKVRMDERMGRMKRLKEKRSRTMGWDGMATWKRGERNRRRAVRKMLIFQAPLPVGVL